METRDRESGSQRKLEALVAVGKVLASTANFERVLATMIATVSDQLGAESAGFSLYDPERDELVLQRPGFGMGDDAIFDWFRIPLSRPSRTRHVFLTRQPFIENDAMSAETGFAFSLSLKTRTLVVAPLVVEDQVIGVVSVRNKRSGGFTREDEDLLVLLAPHLAVTIASAAMFRELREQRRQLERAVQVHAELSKAVFEAPDMAPLAERLAGLIGRGVIVLDAGLRVLARAGGPSNLDWDEAAREGLAEEIAAMPTRVEESSSIHVRLGMSLGEHGAFVAAPIAAGNRTEGYILVAEDAVTPMDAIDVKALEHAATIFAFQLLRQRTAYEVERRLKGELFQALFGQGSDREANRLLDQLGYRTGGPWRVARVEILGLPHARGPQLPLVDANLSVESRVFAALAEAWERAYVGAPLAPWRSGFLSVVSGRDMDGETEAARSARLVQLMNERLAALAPDLRLFFGLGSPVSNAKELGRSLERAEDALGIAQELDMSGVPVYIEELGVQQVLLSPMRNSRTHDDFVQQVLGPLMEYDAAHQGTLMPTLRTLVAADYSHINAAKQLFVHPNTLRHRARRMDDLLGGDLARGETRFRVELALKILDLQKIQARIGAGQPGHQQSPPPLARSQ